MNAALTLDRRLSIAIDREDALRTPRASCSTPRPRSATCWLALLRDRPRRRHGSCSAKIDDGQDAATDYLQDLAGIDVTWAASLWCVLLSTSLIIASNRCWYLHEIQGPRPKA